VLEEEEARQKKKADEVPEVKQNAKEAACQETKWLEEEEAKRTQADEVQEVKQNVKEAAYQSTEQLKEEEANRMKTDEQEVKRNARGCSTPINQTLGRRRGQAYASR
jgi:hypothetical protein